MSECRREFADLLLKVEGRIKAARLLQHGSQWDLLSAKRSKEEALRSKSMILAPLTMELARIGPGRDTTGAAWRGPR